MFICFFHPRKMFFHKKINCKDVYSGKCDETKMNELKVYST